MAPQYPSAPSRATSRVPSGAARSGVIHVNTWHASHYTVVGNHLLQHRELSATAIGVAAYIQSLPDGAPVGIKALAGRFPEGEVRIASALRELERHGYLERRRERLEGGRVVTRTFSYNMPYGSVSGEPPPPPDREPVPAPDPAPEQKPDPAPEPEAEAAPEAQPPHPGAADLLAGLRRRDPRLLLAERDVRRLAPSVSAWLERGVDPETVARVLSAGLPEEMRRPASVLAYRLTALLPPHLPLAPPTPAARPSARPDPLQNCDGCDKAFRAPTPGRCRSCPPAAAAAA
ncbi:helix-turn-helix domain-containing protein [Streptomyces erythrochromogenes]|uniref:helix-turn-helix domain-containing protein n=1 Tax=Streptomyces erythrochromogenes TaxID=285574 RepID=UPI003702CE84